MSEYERIVAAYDKDPKCHNYDFSVARARVAELEGIITDVIPFIGWGASVPDLLEKAVNAVNYGAEEGSE